MIYCPTPHTVFRKTTDGDGIALNLETEQYYTMNEIAVRIWELLQEKKSPAAIATVIMLEYDTTHEQSAADLEAFLADLEDGGLIELV